VTVSEVLERRLGRADAPFGLGSSVSLAAHVAFFVLLVLVSRPRPVTVIPISLPVRIVSPGTLSVRAAAPVAPAPTAVPEKPAKPKRVIEKLNEKPAPSATAMPDPFARKKPVPTPVPTPPAGPALDLPTAVANGGAAGAPGLSFGTSVAALDVDFPFAFYVDQMLTLIGGNWLKPSTSSGTAGSPT